MKYLLTLLLSFIVSLSAFGQNSSSVSGYMTDAVSGDTLIAANVALLYETKGTSSNVAGYYRLSNLKPGRHTVTSSYVGYEKYEQEIVVRPGENLRLNIKLQPKAYEMEEMVIESIKQKEKQRDIGIAYVETSFIKDLPAMFEEVTAACSFYDLIFCYRTHASPVFNRNRQRGNLTSANRNRYGLFR